VRKDKSGMALIFDALMFLTIISIISVALMNAVCVERDGSDEGSYVSEVHKVALACTFEGEGLASLMTIEDVIVLSMLSNDTDLLEEADRQLGKILNRYLSPLYDFHYTEVIGGVTNCFGNEIILKSGDIFVSTIEAEDENGNEMKFVLSVSFA
jgi:hypothetical protein